MQFEVHDPDSGQAVTLEGDSPPTEQELQDIFAEVNKPKTEYELKPPPDFVPPAPEYGGGMTPVIPGSTFADTAPPPPEKPLTQSDIIQKMGGAFGGTTGITPPVTLSESAQALTKPFVAIPEATAEAFKKGRPYMGGAFGGGTTELMPAGQQDFGYSAAASLVNNVKGIVEFGESFGGVATAGAGAGGPVVRRLMGLGFSADIASKIPDAVDAAAEAKTPEEKGTAYVNLAATIGMPIALAMPAIKSAFEPVKPTIAGEPYASRIPETASVPQLEVRPRMGEETPLRQPGQTPGTRIPERSPEAQALPPEQPQAVVEPPPTAQPEIVGMGGAKAGEVLPQPESPTGIKNATVDIERSKRGLPPAVEPARRSFGKVWDDAMAKIDEDPNYPDRLIDELRAKPRALTDTEDATVLQRQIDYQNEHEKVARDLAQAYEDGRTADVDELKLRSAEWSDKLLDLYNIGKKVGTETGRGLAARKMMAYEDFSLANMELTKRAANEGRPLTEPERLEIQKLHDQLADLQRRHDELQARATTPEIEQTLAKAKSTVTKSPKAATELAGLDQTKAKIGAKLKEGELADVSGQVQKLVRAFVEENPEIGRDELVSKVHSVLQEFVPEITRREAMDAISGYGNFKPLTKDAISIVVRDLKGQLQQIGKLEDMASGEPPKKTGLERRTPSDEERRLIKQVEEAKRKGGYKVTDPATQLRTAMQAVKTRLTNEISDLEKQILSREKIVKQKTALEYDAEATQLKARRDELKKQFDEIFPRQPITDAQRLAAWKVRTQNRIQELQDRIASGDFAKREKRTPPALDPEAQNLEAQIFRLKQQFNRGVAEDRLKARPWWIKAQDTFLRWYRGGILSSPVVFAKLTAAAILRAGITPLEEISGAVIKRAVPRLAERAPRQGQGFNSRAEAKSIVSQLTKGPKDAWDTLRTGESDLDILYGKGRESAVGESQVRPFSIADIPGRTHAMVKASTKRAEFERSLELRLTHAIQNGVDASNPAVQLQAAVEAYKDANRAIFLQDNRVVSAYKAALRRFEQPSKVTGKPTVGGKAAATVAKTLVPIVRVPSNIVAEAFEFALGSVTGSARAAKAYAKGIENLPPEQADLIMRELKKGSIGAAALLVGFLNPDIFGGMYQPGEKRKPGDIKAGGARISGVDISPKLTHHPAIEAIQAGATVRRVSDGKQGQAAGDMAIPIGAKAAAFGLVEETPFVREMIETAKAFNPSEQDAYFGELTKSIAVPQLVQWYARVQDVNEAGEIMPRKPKTFAEHLKVGIPGLRQTVPLDPKRLQTPIRQVLINQ